MKWRPTLPFVCVMLILSGAGGMAWGTMGMLNAVQEWAMRNQAELLLTPSSLKGKFYHPTYTVRKERANVCSHPQVCE